MVIRADCLSLLPRSKIEYFMVFSISAFEVFTGFYHNKTSKGYGTYPRQCIFDKFPSITVIIYKCIDTIIIHLILIIPLLS